MLRGRGELQLSPIDLGRGTGGLLPTLPPLLPTGTDDGYTSIVSHDPSHGATRGARPPGHGRVLFYMSSVSNFIFKQ